MALTFNMPRYLGLLQVISGGQVGADQGGLVAAHEMGVATGGVAPLRFRTQWGDNPTLGQKYGLIEDSSYSYPPRTERNVASSDGTLIIGTNLSSPGCILTSHLCRKLQRPCYSVQLTEDYTNDELLEHAPKVVDWMIEHYVTVLNVAGNRDKQRTNSLHFHATHKLVTAILLDLFHRDLLTTKALK